MIVSWLRGPGNSDLEARGGWVHRFKGRCGSGGRKRLAAVASAQSVPRTDILRQTDRVGTRPSPLSSDGRPAGAAVSRAADSWEPDRNAVIGSQRLMGLVGWSYQESRCGEAALICPVLAVSSNLCSVAATSSDIRQPDIRVSVDIDGLDGGPRQLRNWPPLASAARRTCWPEPPADLKSGEVSSPS